MGAGMGSAWVGGLSPAPGVGVEPAALGVQGRLPEAKGAEDRAA